MRCHRSRERQNKGRGVSRRNLGEPYRSSLNLNTTVIVPYTSNPGFVGRSDILEKLKKHFDYGQHERRISQARAALFGLSGIGYTKTRHLYWK